MTTMLYFLVGYLTTPTISRLCCGNNRKINERAALDATRRIRGGLEHGVMRWEARNYSMAL
jgi:hypothetical protein